MKPIEKLKIKLSELFQLDQPELDFGLYRIMNAKAEEVRKFMDTELLQQVQSALAGCETADKDAIKKELSEAEASAKSLGADPNAIPKVQELREKLTHYGGDGEKLENEVYSDIYTFFSRYYQEGDFISLRRYKEGVYAIPYEGEEVKLHWANNDQYYIKTSEYLKDYSFKLQPASEKIPMRVHFRLKDAQEGEHGNVKEAKDKERRFILAKETPLQIENDELYINFEYRVALPDDLPKAEGEEKAPGKAKGIRQEKLTALAVERILATPGRDFLPWIKLLSEKYKKTDGAIAEYSLLKAHLDKYSARNTFDYFIHKDLGAFLRRELDFYIKNEILLLDDIDGEKFRAQSLDLKLTKVKALRKIAHKLIDFLAQLEDFQKKLWLKKKFVVETNYCITLDRIPESFYAEIAQNENQREEWVRLFAIDSIEESTITPAYSKPLAVSFLKANKTLVLDTRFFNEDFKERLISNIDAFDNDCDGVLIHSENFQALNLFQSRYREQIKAIYIDPPYNTDATPINYKNGYKSSSWVSLMDDRVSASRDFLSDNGVLVAAIDDAQQRELNFILSNNFDERILGTICVRSNPSGRPMQTGYSVSHEYLIIAGKSNEASIGRLPPTDQQMSRFNQKDAQGPFEWRNLRREGSNSDRSARRALYYPIYITKTSLRVPEMTWDKATEDWVIAEQPRKGETVVYPDNEEGQQKTWRWEGTTVTSSLNQLAIRPDRSGKDYVYYKRRPHDEGVVSVSSWFDAKYSATEHGTALLKDMFGGATFSYPKSLHAVIDSLYISGASKPNTYVFDYFAGSGTTGHAIIELNRKYGGNRKYLLSEMGAHFNTILLPRIKKAIYSNEWQNGRPANRTSGISHLMKIVRLESYEDTLNNLELKRTKTQDNLLSTKNAHGEGGLREQYFLQYMLDIESRGSKTLLDTAEFKDPWAYKLKTKLPGSDETALTTIDLMETFNYLLGLRVEHTAAQQKLKAKFKYNAEKRLILDGALKTDLTGEYAIRTVSGWVPADTENPNNGKRRKVLIIWRKLSGKPEEDNLVLDEWFKKQKYSTQDTELDLIYVNGDNNLENLKTPEQTWKVRLIEEDFHRLMFAGVGD